MSWDLSFITEEQLCNHVKETIEKYGDKLESINLKKFNKNIVDPIKLIFDKSVYQCSWQEIIKSELSRQRDKSTNNDIGYFHQRIFSYFTNCIVPENGENGGWDIIYSDKSGIEIPNCGTVGTVYVEMKNKHNTMNSSSAAKTFIKMQNQLLKDDDCACFLVEAIAKKSQNIKWETTVDGEHVSHKLIRRVSLDKFYQLVTGDADAFYKLCMKLPDTIQKVVETYGTKIIPNDTVWHELDKSAATYDLKNKNSAMAMAIYMLGFSTYNGFNKLMEDTDENL